MSVAKIVELSAESPEGFEHAVRNGIARANETIDAVKGAWVENQQVVVEDGKMLFRVHMKVTFVLKK